MGSGGEHLKAVRVMHDAQDVAKQVNDRRSCELGLPLQRGGVASGISLHWLTICFGFERREARNCFQPLAGT